jgi:DMSO reductase family type II enzyme chaperone
MELETSSSDRKAGEVDLTLCRATLYSALALGFRPPTEETLKRLTSEENQPALTEAAAMLDRDGAAELASAARLLAAAEHSSVNALGGTFHRLFGHTARGGVPPYETEYGTEALFQQPQEMGDLMGFYRAFGLTLNAREHERADHISCECEFASFLALKEAYALEHEENAMLEETRKATRLFLRDHLGRFAPAFSKKLGREDRDGWYGALAELCYRLVILDCSRLGVPVGPQSLPLRPASDDRVPMACGSGAECMAMPGAGEPEESE